MDDGLPENTNKSRINMLSGIGWCTTIHEKVSAWRRRADSLANNDFRLIFLFVSTVYIIFFACSSTLPILEGNSFRQTQTAISAQYILSENAYFPYLTPIFGPPWSIPFEAPFYIWLVALVQKTSGLSLDFCGRLVSAVSFILIAYPLYRILKHINANAKSITTITFIIALSSTQYLFWSRTFLIETFTLLLCFLYTLNTLNFIKTSSTLSLCASIIFSLMASLMKITTYFAFGVTSIMLAYYLFRWESPKNFRRSIILVAIVFISILAAFGFVAYGDHFKTLSPLTQSLTSDAIRHHNWGTISQRFSSKLWDDTIFGTSIVNSIGSTMVFGMLLFAYAISRKDKNTFFLFLGSMFLYIIPFIAFSNLHMNVGHEYYQTSNAIFLIVASAICIQTLKENGLRAQSVFLLILIILCNYSNFIRRNYLTAVLQSKTSSTMEISEIIKGNTNKSSIVVIGADQNTWTSEYNYYSERKGIMFTSLNYKDTDILQYLNKQNHTDIESIIIFNSTPKEVQTALNQYIYQHNFKEVQSHKRLGCKIYTNNTGIFAISNFLPDIVVDNYLSFQVIDKTNITEDSSFGADRIKVSDGKSSGTFTIKVSSAEIKHTIKGIEIVFYPKIIHQGGGNNLEVQYSCDNTKYFPLENYHGVGNDTQRDLFDPYIKAKVDTLSDSIYIRFNLFGSAEFWYNKEYPVIFNIMTTNNTNEAKK